MMMTNDSSRMKFSAYRSLSARILALVSAPALLIGVAMLWQNSQMSHNLTQSLASLSQKMDEVVEDEAKIQNALVASKRLMTAASGLSNHQQSGLLRNDQAMVKKGAAILEDISASSLKYTEVIQGLTALERVIASIDDAELVKQFNYIQRSAGTVPRLFELAVESHTRTNALIDKNEFSGARVNYIFEERFRMAAALQRITRTSEVLTEFAAGFRTHVSDSARQRQDVILSNSAATSLGTLAYAGIALLVSLGFAILIAMRTITKPLKASVMSLSKLASGDLDITNSNSSITELSDLDESMAVFREKLIEKKKLESQSENERLQAHERQQQAMNTLADQFEESVGSIVQTLSSGAAQQRASTKEVSNSIVKVSEQSSSVMSVSEEGQGNVQTIAAAAEQLSASVGEIGAQIRTSADKTVSVTELAANSVFEVSGLAETARKIDSIVKLIEDIAGQTNLLALNATIEAARAGEAGKGFAIVAQEVKSLAGQTEQATSEIAAQIKDVQSRADRSMRASEEIQSSIEDLKTISDSIVESINQQANATNQISQNVQYFATSNEEVTSNISMITDATSSVANSADEMLDASDRLASTADTLASDVQGFLQRVRAG